MSRNDLNRVGGAHEQADPPISKMQEGASFDPLSFVAPTDFVELPSRGIGYPDSHPLYGKDTIEIKFMTAKEEDILSSRALLKKGVAIERFIESVIIDRKVKAGDLLVGDRNAILIAARSSGYGNLYETQINCPSCGEKAQVTFDLNDKKVKETTLNSGIVNNNDGTFQILMPFSKFKVDFKLLKGTDEIYLTKMATNRKKTNAVESTLSDQYKRMIVKIEGHTDNSIVSRYVDAMPTQDSRHLRKCYKSVTPDVTISKDFECLSCGHEQELEVPFGADFFWPDR